LNKSIKLILNYFLAPVLFVLLCYSIYVQAGEQQHSGEQWQQLWTGFSQPLFYVVLIMMLLNWGLEAWKWQLQLKPLESISFWKAFKSVLAGCSVTMLTPNRIGEYGGRVLWVTEGRRVKAIPLTILGSVSQLVVTLLMGIAGLLVMRYQPAKDGAPFYRLPFRMEEILLWVSIAFTVICALLYFNVHNIVRKLERFNALGRFMKYITALHSFSRKQLLRILLISFFRYLVFILQYLWLLDVTGVHIDFFTGFWIIAVFYLVMALAPTIGFIELPLRAVASVELLRPFTDNVTGIQVAALGIWVINLVIPALWGSLLIFGVKILKVK